MLNYNIIMTIVEILIRFQNNININNNNMIRSIIFNLKDTNNIFFYK